MSSDRRGAQAGSEARRLLDALLATPPPPGPVDLGDTTALPRELVAVPATEMEAVFGPAFARAVEDAPPGRWTGPITSGYGLHLVCVSERLPPLELSGDEARRDAERAWRAEARQKVNADLYRVLRARYCVEVEGANDTQKDSTGSAPK